MKQEQPTSLAEPTEDQIRDYAYHLYCQGGCSPGHEQENWLEAEACLCACIPKEDAHTRLYRHTHQGTVIPFGTSPEAKIQALG